MYSRFISRLAVDDLLAGVITYGGILLMVAIALI